MLGMSQAQDLRRSPTPVSVPPSPLEVGVGEATRDAITAFLHGPIPRKRRTGGTTPSRAALASRLSHLSSMVTSIDSPPSISTTARESVPSWVGILVPDDIF